MSNEDTVEDLLAQMHQGFLEDDEIRPLTKRLVWNLTMDLPMEVPLIADFGIKTETHYRALKAVLETEAQIEFEDLVKELDAAYGNGPALTALVEKYAPQFKGLVFETVWDELNAEKES